MRTNEVIGKQSLAAAINKALAGHKAAREDIHTVAVSAVKLVLAKKPDGSFLVMLLNGADNHTRKALIVWMAVYFNVRVKRDKETQQITSVFQKETEQTVTLKQGMDNPYWTLTPTSDSVGEARDINKLLQALVRFADQDDKNKVQPAARKLARQLIKSNDRLAKMYAEVHAK